MSCATCEQHCSEEMKCTAEQPYRNREVEQKHEGVRNIVSFFNLFSKESPFDTSERRTSSVSLLSYALFRAPFCMQVYKAFPYP